MLFWHRVVKDIGPSWKRYRRKLISELFNEEQAMEAILWFLDRMGVGKKPRETALVEFEGRRAGGG
jgi:hypothetical protein